MPRINKYADITKARHAAVRQLTGERMWKQRAQLAAARKALSEVLEYIEQDLSPEALEAVLSVMQTIAKNPARPGAWRDRTGNLRDSIMVEILKPGQTKTVDYKHGQTTATNDSKNVVGLLYAGMEYAAPLEAKSGYSVLGYAVESMKRRLTPELAKKLKIRKFRRKR